MAKGFMIAMVVLSLLLVAFLTGCSHSMIVKDCNKVDGDSGFSVCKNLKPWE